MVFPWPFFAFRMLAVHLLYADHSGEPTDPRIGHFVLAGVSVFERQGYWLSRELDRIACRFNPADPGAIELHGSPMRQGRGGWHRFPVPDRIQAMKDALGVFAQSHPGNRLFAAVVEPDAVAPRDVVEYAFEQVASRFDQFLMRLYRNRDTQRGVIVFDKATYETAIQSLARDFRTVGHQWGVLRNLAEVPLFLDSKASRLIQLADLVAYAIFRHFEKNDSQYYDIIKNRFDRVGRTQHGLYVRQLRP
jgi:hypothetical protein